MRRDGRTAAIAPVQQHENAIGGEFVVGSRYSELVKSLQSSLALIVFHHIILQIQ